VSIEVVSARVDSLTRDVSRVEGTVDGMDKKLDTLGEAMLLLTRLEERHASVQLRLMEGSKTMAIFGDRLSSIENKMPGLSEMRLWVISGILAGVGMIGAGVIKLVIIDARPATITVAHPAPKE
jgi:hypothetical protein